MDEFALINRFFRRSEDAWKSISSGIATGIGDDCAVLNVTGQQVVVSTDTMVEGRHFPGSGCPRVVASRALGAAVSDLAAMGASPLGFTLSLCLPQVDLEWCENFADCLHEKAVQWEIPLIGGDTVRGPLSVSITVMGVVAPGQAIMRSGAKAGDDIWVSGWLGDAAGGLEVAMSRPENLSASQQLLLLRYENPEPRIELGQQLAGVATSAIDISDGLLSDWLHIARASSVGAEIQEDLVPVREELIAAVGKQKAKEYALSGGDDYELCFTAAPDCRNQISNLSSDHCHLTRIGQVLKDGGLLMINGEGNKCSHIHTGFNHFE
ncbi:thiamine-phosphate kinase [Hahella ganghwensis]|uniref:thiamine-phosphate kinase n=1 Tax=Hahella ganghwensis TaxID=286420 RepID=UPI00035DCBB2|nr:thiamine-phosphate kinase [Hahella ganghwensis]